MYSSLSTGVVAVCVVLPILSTLFVGLRCKMRRSTKAGLGADDYTIIAAEVFPTPLKFEGVFLTCPGFNLRGRRTADLCCCCRW